MKSSSTLRQRNGSKVSDKERLSHLARGQEALEKEKVFIKATGRAIEKAMSVGRWFEQRQDEYAVRIKTGSVMVVDDILEDEEAKMKERQREEMIREENQMPADRQSDGEEQGTKEGQVKEPVMAGGGAAEANESSTSQDPAPSSSKSISPRKKKGRREKRAVPPDTELPESRTRWVNMVEIAINLK
jgi:ribonuclease P/MRP protein subunit POP7